MQLSESHLIQSLRQVSEEAGALLAEQVALKAESPLVELKPEQLSLSRVSPQAENLRLANDSQVVSSASPQEAMQRLLQSRNDGRTVSC